MSVNQLKPVGETDILQATKEITIAYINNTAISDRKDDIFEIMKKTHDTLMELFNHRTGGK